MKVTGTVVIEFEIDLQVEDISQDTMSMYESDVLIAQAIDQKLPKGLQVEGDIRVLKSYKEEIG